jgi:hypothetical protein
MRVAGSVHKHRSRPGSMKKKDSTCPKLAENIFKLFTVIILLGVDAS